MLVWSFTVGGQNGMHLKFEFYSGCRKIASHIQNGKQPETATTVVTQSTLPWCGNNDYACYSVSIHNCTNIIVMDTEAQQLSSPSDYNLMPMPFCACPLCDTSMTHWTDSQRPELHHLQPPIAPVMQLMISFMTGIKLYARCVVKVQAEIDCMVTSRLGSHHCESKTTYALCQRWLCKLSTHHPLTCSTGPMHVCPAENHAHEQELVLSVLDQQPHTCSAM